MQSRRPRDDVGPVRILSLLSAERWKGVDHGYHEGVCWAFLSKSLLLRVVVAARQTAAIAGQ